MNKILDKAFLTLNLLFLFIITHNNSYASTQRAVFAMGCFWCAESEFVELNGVSDVVTGYAGGISPNPTYKSHQGYKEAVQITFDSEKISYLTLLEVFWRNIDPFDRKGQFCDKGDSYMAAIFHMNDAQKQAAIQSKQTVRMQFNQDEKFKDSEITTLITQFTNFFPAEEYHQDYKEKNPLKYKYYRWTCGRDARLEEIWG